MNILLYSSFNSRARDAETLMIAFKNQGHRVISLTQAEGEPINSFLIGAGIEALSFKVVSKNKLIFTLRHILHLIRLCKRENIDIIYCHLEPASFVGVLAQYFIQAKVYLCRHHIDEALLYNFNKSISYRLTYRLAKKIIVVSSRAKKFMTEIEKIPANKIIHINLAYDFSLFNKPIGESVGKIKVKFDSEILLITVGRLTQFKRPELSVQVLRTLILDGIDAKLIILGTGEMYEALTQIIVNENLTDKIFLMGYVQNVLDYMAAATFLVHPSILESSCVVVKEAGLIRLPVIACRGIGDFDEYLVNGKNGFLVNQETFVTEAVDVVKSNLKSSAKLNSMTANLHQDILRIFSINQIIHSYDQINHQNR
jgi:glycosyltransferase involved in cell wall biosynthesis